MNSERVLTTFEIRRETKAMLLRIAALRTQRTGEKVPMVAVLEDAILRLAKRELRDVAR